MLVLHTIVGTMHAVNIAFKWSSIIGASKVLVLSETALVSWLLIELQAMLVAIGL